MAEIVTYRRAAPADQPAIERVLRAAYAEFSYVLEPDGWHELMQKLTEPTGLNELLMGAVAFVAEAEEGPVGVIFWIPSGQATDVFPAQWSYIRKLGVDPAYRGQGIGRRLTELCLDEARRRGESVVALQTSEMLGVARAMYEQFGFVEVKDLRPEFGIRSALYARQL